MTWLDTFRNWNTRLSEAVWGAPMIALLLLTGLVFTIGTGFFQIRYAGEILKSTVGALFHKSTHAKSKTGLSQFQTLAASLGATIGTGSVVGAAAAIAVGGAGAVFWMWVSAFFGMMTSFAENVLAIRYRTKKNGVYSASAADYMARGLKAPWLGAVFSCLCVMASFGMGNMAQVNSISAACRESFGIPTAVTGIVLCAAVFFILRGGMKKLGAVAEKLVPFMALFFTAGAVFIILKNISALGGVFTEIFQSAFGIQSAAGGAVGISIQTAMATGFRRGVFSHEAGLGTTVAIHAASEIQDPVRQGMWGIFEVFVDTMVITTLTALTVLVTGSSRAGEGSETVVRAFSDGFGSAGGYFVSVSILLFALATLLSWSMIGAKSWESLFPHGNGKTYRLLFCLCVLFGSVMSLEAVWNLSDTLNGLMAIPNLTALLLLSGEVFRETKQFRKKLQQKRLRQKP